MDRIKLERIVDYISDLVDDAKHVDLKKQARKIRRHAPEVSFDRGSLETNDFILGMVIGGMVGFLVALLIAPKSGSQTRALISDKTHMVGEKAKDTIEGVVDKTGRLAAEGRDRVESTLKRGQKQYDTAKMQGRDVAYEARERVSDTLDRAADEIDPNPRF